ncbi:hypothetical protein LTR56_025578 [Elasticomyces elasticus]|nr:hypothetical protein LTR56_025578 [Elasticomyces elasticus]KAK3622299.1 hypothetical protein LTR22_024852 [Elasticomyces elasticus]KAK4906010.1 hypothetical protein LTR49_024773 [Elasticomyces elasticus]KAK5742406.1 hypothetical protein LTS12_024253 [Elasticomyces elasticus]
MSHANALGLLIPASIPHVTSSCFPKILRSLRWRSCTEDIKHDEEPAYDEEKMMYQTLRNVFNDDSVHGVNNKLSFTLARMWASMIDKVVFWEITKFMGESLKIHAQALTSYEDAMLVETEQNIPSPTPQLQPRKTDVAAF